MKILDALKSLSSSVLSINNGIGVNNALLVESIYRQRLSEHKNLFAKKYAKKYFSQTDEDGLTLEIINRIRNAHNGYGKFFAEFGVGDGCENNTLVLLSLGWKGSWFGGQQLAFDTEGSKSLRFQKSWITRDNIASLYQQALKEWSIDEIDVVSLDLDGNDFYFIQNLLSNNHKPPLFICEYNAIFPVDANWQITYDDNHQWQGDHYFGASLGSLVQLFSTHDYFLCACNPHTGANAFFVRNEYRHLFPDIPNRIEDIYVQPFYLLDNKFTHRISPHFIRSLIV
jgi:hypothetical protein